MIGAMARAGVSSSTVALGRGGFEEMMRAEQGRIWRLCFHFLGDREEANSLTQEVFLKAYRALERPTGQAVQDPAKWLTRIAVNSCLDRLRSKRWQFWRRRIAAEDEAVMLSMKADPAPGAEDLVLGAEISARLNQALRTLSSRQRAAFVLKHYEDRPLKEIAELMGLDVGTVKAHLARALQKLRSELHDLYFGPEPGRDGRNAGGEKTL